MKHFASKQRKTNTLAFAAVTALAISLNASVYSQPVYAGGLIGDVFRAVGQVTGVKQLEQAGNSLDQSHDRIKKNHKLYGKAEEGLSGGVRHAVKESTVETLGPTLAALIKAGKADAQNGKLEPLPANVKRALSTYFEPGILDKARWRVGGGDLTIQAGSIKLGSKDAVVLDDIIVFRNADMLNNLHLVAHEMGHVVQYHNWGITDFAKRYVRDYHGVEADADRMAVEWKSGKRRHAAPKQALEPYVEPCMRDSKYHCF